MARKIKDVLTESEIERIKLITDEFSDESQSRIIANVSHIACDVYRGIVSARVYIDPRQPYERLYSLIAMRKRQGSSSPFAERDYGAMANELLARRRGHIYDFKGRPHERKVYEAELRKKEIEANRHYLREAEGKDPGLFLAAAHWLKEYSNVFCALAESQYLSLGVENFSFFGMERAVVIDSPGNEGNFLSVIVLSSDLTCEETVAQYAAGIEKLAMENDPEFSSKAGKLREEILKAEEAMHFCVLGGRRTK